MQGSRTISHILYGRSEQKRLSASPQTAPAQQPAWALCSLLHRVQGLLALFLARMCSESVKEPPCSIRSANNYLVIMQWEWKRSKTVTGVKNRCCSVRATCFLITDNPIQPCPLCQLIWALQWEWSNNKCPALDNSFSSFQRKDLSHFHKQSYFPVIGLTWWTGPNNFTVNLDLISSSTLLALSQVLSSAVVNWENIIPARTQVILVTTLWFRSSACHLSPIKQWKVYKCIYS